MRKEAYLNQTSLTGIKEFTTRGGKKRQSCAYMPTRMQKSSVKSKRNKALRGKKRRSDLFCLEELVNVSWNVACKEKILLLRKLEVKGLCEVKQLFSGTLT